MGSGWPADEGAEVPIWEELGNELRGNGNEYVQNTLCVYVLNKSLKLHYKKYEIINSN